MSEHPQWCDRARCEASLGRCHTSVPVVIRARSGARVQVRLFAIDGHFPILEIIAGHHDDGRRYRVDLTPAEAADLHRHIGACLDAAAADPPPADRDGYAIGARRWPGLIQRRRNPPPD